MIDKHHKLNKLTKGFNYQVLTIFKRFNDSINTYIRNFFIQNFPFKLIRNFELQKCELTMNMEQKRSVLSFMVGIGFIILVLGIFLPNFDFSIAIFLAMTIWILTGVASKFIGVTRKGEYVYNSGWRYGIVSLIGSLGFIVLLAGIFYGLNFSYALAIAISFWILSGVLSSSLGIKRSHRNKYTGLQPPRPQYTPPMPIGSPYPPKPPKYSSSPSYSKSYYSDEPAKNFCQKCGSSMEKDDTFCSNCGTSVLTSF